MNEIKLMMYKGISSYVFVSKVKEHIKYILKSDIDRFSGYTMTKDLIKFLVRYDESLEDNVLLVETNDEIHNYYLNTNKEGNYVIERKNKEL